jgi:hypothetical protein
MQQVLRQDPNVVAFVPAEEYEPLLIDYTRFSSKNGDVREKVETLQRIMNYGYIFDGFKDHLERDSWRRSYIDEFGEDGKFVYQNSLRRNKLAAILRAATELEQEYNGLDQVEFSILVGNVTRHMEALKEFKKYTLFQKMQLAMQIKADAYKVLRHVGYTGADLEDMVERAVLSKVQMPFQIQTF